MIPELERLVTDLEAVLTDDLPVVDLCSLWLDLVEFRKEVDLVVRSVEEEATEALHAQFGDDASGKPFAGKRTVFETPAGVVRLEREAARRRAYGRAVVEVLSRPVVTAEGELLQAVPVDVLRAVLPPAATSEDPTSFAWRFRELREFLGEQYPILVDETPIEDRAVRIRAGEGWP